MYAEYESKNPSKFNGGVTNRTGRELSIVWEGKKKVTV